MKRLSRLQSAVMLSGAILMLVGAALGMMLRGVAPYLFASGSLMYVSMQFLQRYEGNNLTIGRLRRILLLSDILLLLVAALMFADQDNAFGIPWQDYLMYIHNNWVVVLLIAAVIQLYTVFRIDSELAKEAKKR